MKKLIVTLLSPRRIRQGKKWKQGSTNLNPVRVFWNSRCAILHLISNPPSPLTTNKKKNHRAYQKCYMTMCWGIKWSSDGNKCDGHSEKMTWRLPKLEWSSTMLYVWKGAHTHTRLQTCSIAIRGVLRAFSSMWQDAIKGSPVMRLLGLFRALAVPPLYSPQPQQS